VDLTSYIAGSYAAMQLADMGADVVKVESLEGDSFRELPGFFGWNRGKRSIALNLKTPEGRAIVETLATRGDVFMENMRPGVADRLGVGHRHLSSLNPRLVYCSVTAFGSTGPGTERPGFDPIFQALGGLMTLQGFGGPPQYLRTAPTDYYTAAVATQGILAVGNQAFWTKLCTALDMEDLAADPRFASWLLRLQNNQALLPLIEEKFKSAPRAHWLERLAKHDIPVAPVQTVAEFMEHPAVRHHDLVHEYEHPEVGRLRMMGQPLVFDDTPTRDPGPPPTLGQHTGEILTELGYSGAAIADLRQRRVLGGPAE